MRRPKRINIRRCTPLVILSLLFLFATPAYAEERILRYESEIIVNADGSAHVTETIRVRTEGDAIRRGIYRDIPTQRGQRVTFSGATRDGIPDGTRQENRGNTIRLYVGKADQILAPSVYTYELSYTVTNVVRREGDEDQLHWNVTGNGWAFPIDEVSALVMFDADVPVAEMTVAGYTGPYGAKGRAYSITREGDGAIRIESTSPLPRSHGLTVTAGIPDGYFDLQAAPVIPPVHLRPQRTRETAPAFPVSQPDRAFDDAAWIAFAGALFVPFAYFMVVWVFIGRDSLRGRIPVSSDIPDDISPSAARYLTNRGYDSKTFASAILRMANKGHLTLERTGDQYSISIADDGRSHLAPDEESLFEAIDLAGKDAITTGPDHATRVHIAAQTHAAYLHGAYRGSHFTLNRGWWLVGCVIAIAAVTGAVAFGTEDGRAGSAIYVPILVVSTGFLIHGLALLGQAWKGRIAYGSNYVLTGKAMSAGCGFILAAGVITAIMAVLLTMFTHIACTLIAITTGCLCWLFYVLMPAPTRTGRKALDRIEAFAETFRDGRGAVSGRVPLNDKPAYFDERFAYALALDAVDDWAIQYGNALGPNADSEAPSWYKDDDLATTEDLPDYLAKHAGSEFAKAVGGVRSPQIDTDSGDWTNFGGTGTSGFGSFGAGGIGGGSFGGGGFSGGGGFGGGGGFSGGGSGGGGGGGW